MPGVRRNELADFLRSRRARLSPGAVGLPGGRRRRTPGLRREEVAELAGIGIDWYVRIEQGRSVSPSLATIDALARALRLDAVEHAHLRRLARIAEQAPFAREQVPETIIRIVRSLDQPAYVRGRRWDVLAWNAAASALFKDFGAVAEADRNILVFMFTDPDARQRFGDGWEEQARRVVAQFRSSHDEWAGDPAFAALLERLRRESPEFNRWWDAHDIRDAPAGRKLMHHPVAGAVLYEYATFQANSDAALKLVIYTPA